MNHNHRRIIRISEAIGLDTK